MTNIKELLEQTGMKVAECSFKKTPQLPYIVFNVEENNRGSDENICIVDRSIMVELYSNKIDKEAEVKIEKLLKEKSIGFTKSRTWIEKDSFLQTMYDFNLIEKNRRY